MLSPWSLSHRFSVFHTLFHGFNEADRKVDKLIVDGLDSPPLKGDKCVMISR